MLLLKNIAPESKGLGAMAMSMVLLVAMTVTATDSSQASDKLGDAKDMKGLVKVITLDDYSEKTSLTDDELKHLLTLVGFKGSALKTAWAVAKKESNGRPKAHNQNPATGDNSYGVFQINMLGSLGEDRREKFSLLTNSDLFNPVKNAQIAFYMSNEGQDWSSWTHLEGERFKSFLLQYSELFKNNKEN